MMKIAFAICLLGLLINSSKACRGLRKRRETDLELNNFFVDCMRTKSSHIFTWESVVDNIIFHSSWYYDNGNGDCNIGNNTEQTICWTDVMGFLISSTSSDLSVARECVCDYYISKTGATVCPTARRKRETFDQGVSMDSLECPEINTTEYSQDVAAMVTIEDMADRTFEDFESVVQFMSVEGKCDGTCNCSERFSNTFEPSQLLDCTTCWPTRLSSLMRDASPIKRVARQTAFALEFSNPPMPTQIVCDSSGVQIRIGRKNRFNVGFRDGDRLVVWNESVSATSDVPQSCRSFSPGEFSFNLNQCRPESSMNNTHILIKYYIQKVVYLRDEIVQRFEDGCITVQCAFEKDSLLSSEFISPKIEKLTFGPINETGVFPLVMEITDSTFTTALSPGATIVVPDFVHVRVKFEGDVTEVLILQAVECWASTDNTGDPPRYDIINTGCPTNEMYDGAPAVEVLNNSQSNEVHLKFRAFVWSDSLQNPGPIFTHCVIEVCDSLAENCTLTCPNKRRRDVDFTLDDDRQSKYQILTSDQINFVLPSDCLIDNGGCEDICEISDNIAVCSCSYGRELQSDGSSCSDVQEDTPTYEDIYVALLLVFCFVLAMFLIIHLRNDSN